MQLHSHNINIELGFWIREREKGKPDKKKHFNINLLLHQSLIFLVSKTGFNGFDLKQQKELFKSELIVFEEGVVLNYFVADTTQDHGKLCGDMHREAARRGSNAAAKA